MATVKKVIQTIDACDYLEVFEVTELRDGFIYKTRTTGKFIHRKYKDKLPKNYTTASMSTNMMLGVEFITLSMFTIEAGDNQ